MRNLVTGTKGCGNRLEITAVVPVSPCKTEFFVTGTLDKNRNSVICIPPKTKVIVCKNFSIWFGRLFKT